MVSIRSYIIFWLCTFSLLMFLIPVSLGPITQELAKNSGTTKEHTGLHREPDEKITKSPGRNSIHGIDISSYQGDIDFAKVKKAGITFVIIKATQGNTYRDPRFKNNVIEAKNAGLVVGAYHYYMTDDDPVSQFANFSSQAILTKGDLPPAVDIEAMAWHSKPHLHVKLQTFLNELERHYGVKPILYSGLYFANKNLSGFADYPLWLAQYEVEKPTIPKGWKTWHFWQWSQFAKIDGIQGSVDVDRFNGDEAAFQTLLIR